MLSSNSANMRSLKLHNKGVYFKGRYHKSQNYYTVLGSKRVDFWILKMGRWGPPAESFQFWSKMVQLGPTYLGLMGFCWDLSWPVLTLPANCEDRNFKHVYCVSIYIKGLHQKLMHKISSISEIGLIWDWDSCSKYIMYE